VEEPAPIFTLEQAGAAALKDSLTASGVLNDNRKDSARGLEEEGSPTAETPPIARATAASETESVSTEVDAVGIDEKEAVQPASETESVPAEVDAVGIDEKEAVQPEKLDTGTKGDSTKDVAAAEAVDGDENGASREEELSPGPKDHPPTVTTEAEAIDPKESEAALRPAESPAERQAVAPRSMETVQLLDMPSTSPLLASALVVAAGLLIRRSMR